MPTFKSYARRVFNLVYIFTGSPTLTLFHRSLSPALDDRNSPELHHFAPTLTHSAMSCSLRTPMVCPQQPARLHLLSGVSGVSHQSPLSLDPQPQIPRHLGTGTRAQSITPPSHIGTLAQLSPPTSRSLARARQERRSRVSPVGRTLLRFPRVGGGRARRCGRKSTWNLVTMGNLSTWTL